MMSHVISELRLPTACRTFVDDTTGYRTRLCCRLGRRALFASILVVLQLPSLIRISINSRYILILLFLTDLNRPSSDTLASFLYRLLGFFAAVGRLLRGLLTGVLKTG